MIVDSSPDGVTIDFQGVLTIWPPSEAKRLAKALVDCADTVEAQKRAGGRGLVLR